MSQSHKLYRLFFFNDTATTEIYTLSLHDALPIYTAHHAQPCSQYSVPSIEPDVRRPIIDRPPLCSIIQLTHRVVCTRPRRRTIDRKSTRLNSSHANISYAVFCLKKKTSIGNTLII